MIYFMRVSLSADHKQALQLGKQTFFILAKTSQKLAIVIITQYLNNMNQSK